MRFCPAKMVMVLVSLVLLGALSARSASAAAPVCGNGIIEGGERCEACTPGGALPACCNPANCKVYKKSDKHVCRVGSDDMCDPSEVCTGDATCPADIIESDQTVCRAAVNECDVAATCTGVAGQACPANPPKDCSDGNVCTTDTCDPATGCEHANNTDSCDDGDACTTADRCVDGSCAGGPAPNCDDGNLCTDDSCDSAIGCVNENNTVSCDDGLFCTSNDTCSGGVCVGAETTCDDSNPCTDDTCVEEGQTCTYKDNGSCGTSLRDFNGDFVDDVVMRNTDTAAFRLFLFDDGKAVSNAGFFVPFSSPLDWKVVGEGDFDGDADTDLLLRNSVTGAWREALMNGVGSIVTRNPGLYTGADWVLAGVGDENDDWTEDVVLRNTTTGAGRVFFLRKGLLVSDAFTALTSSLNWKVVGTGDFDGDGVNEILQRHVNTGAMRMVFVLPDVTPAVMSTLSTPADPTVSVACVADFDGDGDDDILTHSASASYVVTMQLGSVVGINLVTLDPAQTVELCEDFNGDGTDDVLLRDPGTGVSTTVAFDAGEPTISKSSNLYKAAVWEVVP